MKDVFGVGRQVLDFRVVLGRSDNLRIGFACPKVATLKVFDLGLEESRRQFVYSRIGYMYL